MRLVAGRGLAGLLALLLWLAPAAADQTGPWRGMPWHLMDWFHVLPDGKAFQSVAVDVDIHTPPQPGDNIYIAALYGHIGDQAFYVGLQTDLHDGRKRVFRGEGLIFSRWGNGEGAHGRAPAEGWVVTPNPNAAREGDYVSIRRPFAWDAGRYVFQLQSRPPADGGPGQWVDLLVFDAAAGKWIDGGSLRFDDAPATFRPRPVTFVEVYRLPRDGGPDDVAPVEITVRGPLLNGAHRPLGGTPYVPPDVPPLATATAGADGAVRITVAPPKGDATP